MGDWDYGRANGLWGDDGIPYGIDREEAPCSTKIATKSKSYNSSEQLAYDNGYRALYKKDAYNGRYFVKNGKIWIHNITALKKILGTKSDYQLERDGYDVDAYYRFH